MGPKIDFSRLTLRGALDFAITIEEDAEYSYAEFALRVKDPATIAFFKEMVVNEGKHRRSLEARRSVLFRNDQRFFDSPDGEDVEAPDPAEVYPEMGPHEAMRLALRAEERAWTFYDQAIAHLSDPDVKAFFEELRAEEVEHQALLKEKLLKLGPELVRK